MPILHSMPAESPRATTSRQEAPGVQDATALRNVSRVGASRSKDLPEEERKRRVRLMCACTSAVLWWAAGQSWGLFALGWIALVPLFWALLGCSGRARLRLGFTTGCCAFAFINWWIAPTIARAAEAIGVPFWPGALLGVLAVALIACLHGSLVALIAWAWNPSACRDARGENARAENAGGKRKQPGREIARQLFWPPAIALAWSLLDAARSETALAHAWGALAYTQWRDLALWQSAAVVGQHGLTFLCVWFAASLALWMRSGHAILWRLPVAVFVICHIWGARRLVQTPFLAQDAAVRDAASGAIDSRTALAYEYLGSARAASSLENARAGVANAAHNAKGLRVLLVQTDVPSLRKSVADEPFRQAYALTRGAARRGEFDLIAWPETTATVSLPMRPSNTTSIASEMFGARARSESLAARETHFGDSQGGATPSDVMQSDAAQSDAAREEAMGSANAGQMRALAALSRDLQTPILFGARDIRGDGENFNRAVILAPDGRFWSSAKERLVPFGERAPFARLFPFLHRLAPQPEVSDKGSARLLPLQFQPPLSKDGPRMSTYARDVASAKNIQKAQAKGVEVPVGAIICFESCFRFPARRLGLAGAQVLFVLTNDEWFGGTDAPWQHSVMAALRAVENDVPVAQAGNGGFSFAVDRRGRFMVKSSLNQARALKVFLPLDESRSGQIRLNDLR